MPCFLVGSKKEKEFLLSSEQPPASANSSVSEYFGAEKLQRLIELVDEAVISVDTTQSVCSFNPGAERMFGYKAEEIIGRPLGDLIPSHLRDLHACHVRTFLESSDKGRWMGERQELTGLRQDGSTFPARASIFKSRLPGGETELTAILQDISEDKYIKEIEESVRLSRQIQLHFFPQNLPRISGVDLAAANVPTQGISGDYYDFIKIVEDHWGLVIADVSGKGLSAGLLMSSFRATLLAEIRNNYALPTILKKVNNLLWESSEENRFVTAFYGVFDEQHRILTYCNAGHNPPILMGADGDIKELETGGFILGAFPGSEYQEGHILLSVGDLLLLYTDGLTEAIGADGEELGRAGLIQFLGEHSGESASSISQALVEWAEGRESTPHDDITLLVMRITGGSE
jgi:PAS domain S-box-containing protein